MGRTARWFRARPDRPFIILFAHLCIVSLYLSGHAVTPIAFTNAQAQTLISSDLLPVAHGVAAIALAAAIWARQGQLYAGTISLVVWSATTGTLFFASHSHVPQLSYWSFALSLVITAATFLMLVNWGVPNGTERESS